MNAYCLRSLTATVLSLWLGFLACVLGCAQPVLASTPSSHPQICEPQAAANEDNSSKIADAGPCCHHSGGASQKNKQGAQTVSCCPLDATLIQKQDPVSPISGHSYVVVLMLLVLRPLFQLSATNETNPPTVWHAGRDVLLKVHVLRI
jgi:hypothetical protein